MLTTGISRWSTVVPVKDAPPLPETLKMILLLQAPAVLTPVYRLVPKALNPAGVHPLDSLESRLM